jgi:hemerythrin-like domain-containing protein
MNVVREVDRPTSQAAIETLIREHRNIEMLLVMLDSYFAAMSAGDDVDESLLVDAMTYMTEYVGKFHHSKEQLAIEVVAERSPTIADAKPELEAQHGRIREAGSWLRATLEQVLRDAPVSRQKLIATGLSYTAEMRRNIELEEHLVFPALTEGLDAAAWQIIRAKLPQQPDPLFGEAVHQRYAELFHELVERFGLEGEARYE